jgi:DNA-directed RNA polymerase subunit beta'
MIGFCSRTPIAGGKLTLEIPTPRYSRQLPGAFIFNQIWPKELGFFNKPAGKKQLSDIIWRCYQIAGPAVTVATLG